MPRYTRPRAYVKRDPTLMRMGKKNLDIARLARAGGMKYDTLYRAVMGLAPASPAVRELLMKELEVKQWDSLFYFEDLSSQKEPVNAQGT